MKPFSAFFNLIAQFIPLLLTFLLAAASYWFAIQSELGLFNKAGEKDPTRSDYYLRNFSVQSHNLLEGRYSIIRSPAAEHIPQGNLWKMTDPEMDQFVSTDTAVKGRAKQAEYQLDTEEIILRQEVTVSSLKQGLLTILNSEEVHINNRSGEVATDEKVLVTRPGQRFEANGARLNNKTGELKAEGAIRFRVEAKQQ